MNALTSWFLYPSDFVLSLIETLKLKNSVGNYNLINFSVQKKIFTLQLFFFFIVLGWYFQI